MTSNKPRPSLLLSLLLLCTSASADGTEIDFGGHTKFRLLGQTFPDNSLFRELIDAEAIDVEGDLRFNFSADAGRWSIDAAYQLFAAYGDSVEISSFLDALGFQFPGRLPDDDTRLLDLTHVVNDSGKRALVHRLDRLAVGYTGERVVLRIGRQALSWGNGLFYAPMDLVNPFDPAAIDTEFKAGDDLLYAQYLRGSGDDVQAAVVFRRDPASSNVERNQATTAIKYHAFIGSSELDLLLAEHYDDTVLGLGLVSSIGGAVLRGDAVLTNDGADKTWQFVTNLSYAWLWGGKNVSAALEYYFNGFGQHGGSYEPLALAANPALLERLARGESYTLSRHYMAGSLLVEVTPLLTLTPTLLVNLSDPSALLQLVMQRSVGNNMTVLGSLNIPLGPDGSEFGGIPSGMDSRYLSRTAGLFAQFAWYF